MSITIEISVPDAEQLLKLLESSPDNFPDVIDELQAALEEVR